MKLQLANRSILQCLELAAERSELIETLVPHHRKLGKSKALVQFAKENNYTIIVHSGIAAKYLAQEYGYKNIKSINSKGLEGIRECVIDEMITKEDLEKLRGLGCTLVTGFMSVRTN
ncbi:hypothetical protein AB1L05_09015 [Cytobacillus horneckiae]|uniref:hypothetical protein n=1 Tax=Cytobacillus horneckiae TaxID=549687 RepID=UPI0039A32F40